MAINVYSLIFILLLLFSFFLYSSDEIKVIDDEKLVEGLKEKLNIMHKENSFSDINLLYDQLARNTCKVSLSKPLSKNKDLKEVYKRSLKSTLMIVRAYKSKTTRTWQTSIACGFLISKDGIAVTNYHVMEPSRGTAMAAMTFDGKVYSISEVLAADKKNDIAIIKLKGIDFTPLSLSKGNVTGTSVLCISHPDGRFYTLSTGIVNRHFIDSDKGLKAHRFAISADFAKGSSGGPILDLKGNVVGMVSSTRSIYYNRSSGVDENLQMVIKNCVPSQSILKLLEVPSK